MFSKLFYILTVFLKLKISFEMIVSKNTIFVIVNSVHGGTLLSADFFQNQLFRMSTF